MRSKKRIAFLMAVVLVFAALFSDASLTQANAATKNSITKLEISNIPDGNSIQLADGCYYNFNHKVVSKQGKGKVTDIVWWEVNSKNNDVFASSSQWGYVYPVCTGEFQIRAISFASTSNLNKWKAARKANGNVANEAIDKKYATAWSDWETITVTGNDSLAVARTQSQLNFALKNKKITEIHIVTKKGTSFTIPSNDYRKKTLIIDSPKSNITNSGKFAEIVLGQTGKDGFTEKTTGNKILVTSDSAYIKLENKAKLNRLEINSESDVANVTIEINNGYIMDTIVTSRSNIQIVGQAPVNLPISIMEAADATMLSTEVSSRIKVHADSDIVSLKNNINIVVDFIEKADITFFGSESTIKANISEKAENSSITLNTRQNLTIDADSEATISFCEESEESSVTVLGNGDVTIKNNTNGVINQKDTSGNVIAAIQPGSEAGKAEITPSATPTPTENPNPPDVPVIPDVPLPPYIPVPPIITTPDPEPTPTPTEEVKPTPTVTPTPTATPTPTEEAKPTPTVTPTPTATPTPSPIPTATPSPTPTPFFENATEYILAGDEIQLVLKNTDKEITWESDDIEVATVDEKGLVKAIKNGATHIWARTDEHSYFCTIQVLLIDDMNIYTGESFNATYKVGESIQSEVRFGGVVGIPIDKLRIMPEAISWNSSDENIATVSQNGLINTIENGRARITATYKNKTVKYDIIIFDQDYIEENIEVKIDLDLAKQTQSVTSNDIIVESKMKKTFPIFINGRILFYDSDNNAVAIKKDVYIYLYKDDLFVPIVLFEIEGDIERAVSYEFTFDACYLLEPNPLIDITRNISVTYMWTTKNAINEWNANRISNEYILTIKNDSQYDMERCVMKMTYYDMDGAMILEEMLDTKDMNKSISKVTNKEISEVKFEVVYAYALMED